MMMTRKDEKMMCDELLGFIRSFDPSSPSGLHSSVRQSSITSIGLSNTPFIDAVID
jgi:hypothetical protein